MTADCPLPNGSVLRFTTRTHVMGIVNVTPDSFSDGGLYFDEQAAIDHGIQLAEEGADILDVGGESTRPGAQAVDVEEELRRVIPVVEALVLKTRVAVSVDTSKALVAERALQHGASIVNDVSAGRFDPRILDVASKAEAAVVLMHMQGDPRTMQQQPAYTDVVEEVCGFLAERAAAAKRAGVPSQKIILDPGIGFGKTVEHNLALLNHLDRIADLDFAIACGTSRKSFIGKILGQNDLVSRVEGTAATVALSIVRGASIVRVHDVRAMVNVVRMTDAIVRSAGSPGRSSAQT